MMLKPWDKSAEWLTDLVSQLYKARELVLDTFADTPMTAKHIHRYPSTASLLDVGRTSLVFGMRICLW